MESTGVVQIQNVPHSYKNGYYTLSLAEQWTLMPSVQHYWINY